MSMPNENKQFCLLKYSVESAVEKHIIIQLEHFHSFRTI